MTSQPNKPCLMVFSGLDCTGGAGIQADIETISSLGCHAMPIITASTIQNTGNFIESVPQDPEVLLKQADIVLEDIPVDGFKLGFLGNAEIAEAVDSILNRYPGVPVVLDPVTRSGGGTLMANDDLVYAIKHRLLEHTTVVTPNSLEARQLAPEADTIDACAMSILDHEVEYVLVTGEHECTEMVVNTLYSAHSIRMRSEWQRLEGKYHGSGCTLSAAIAAMIGQGMDPASSVRKAQEFTWNSLQSGWKPGTGQSLPNRFFWT